MKGCRRKSGSNNSDRKEKEAIKKEKERDFEDMTAGRIWKIAMHPRMGDTKPVDYI